MSCSTYKTIQVDFTEPEIKPLNGYLIKWRVQGTSDWVQLPNQFGTPIFIPSVPICQNIEGTISADCGSGNFGNPMTFGVSAEIGTCYSFQLLQDAQYSFLPCGQNSEAQFVQNIASTPTTICATDGTVSGGHYSRLGTCNA